MDQPRISLAQYRCAMEAARDASAEFAQVLHQASGSELGELMTLVDEVSAGAGAVRLQVTLEAITRGEVTSAGVNAHTWVSEHAPSLRQGGAGPVAKIAAAARQGRADVEPGRRCPRP